MKTDLSRNMDLKNSAQKVSDFSVGPHKIEQKKNFIQPNFNVGSEVYEFNFDPHAREKAHKKIIAQNRRQTQV